VEAVCKGQTAAVLLVASDAESFIADPPAACSAAPFRFLRVPRQSFRYSIASKPHLRATCDRLNRAIEDMAEDGTLDQLIAPWQGLHSSASESLRHSVTTTRKYWRMAMLTVGSVTALLGVLLWHERSLLRKVRLLQQRTGMAEDRYRDLFASPLMAVFVIECPGGKILSANPAFYRLLGLAGAPAEPLILDELVAHRPASELTALRELAETPQRGPVQTEFRHGAGPSAPVMVATAFAKRSAGPEIAEVLAVAMDATPFVEVRELAAQLLGAEDQERRRIARELHDSTAQKVAGLIMLLDLQANCTELLPQMRTLATDALEELRSFSYLLHPPFLDELGLAVALRTYLDGFEQRSGIAVDATIPEQVSALPPATSLALFRIVQESLANVQRHSQSQWVSVKLSQNQDEVQLTVRDGGPPTLPQPAGPGVGIGGMQERARHLGGRLEVKSGSTGTTVRAHFPTKEA
jgi:signal transduction histidine kinase